MPRNPASLVLLLIISTGCGGGSTSGDDSPPPVNYVYQQPPASICDTSMSANGGLICAIQPSRLDTNTRDSYGNANAGDLLLGFGYHVVAFPPSTSDIKGVYVHLTGSYGRPYNQFSDVYGNAAFLDEAVAAGYITIQLAYHNRFSVNIDECGDVANLGVDNCSGDVRMEKIVGTDVSSVVDVPIADSIEFRLETLVDYLETQGFEFPFDVVANGIINWPSLSIGGHSQGATHALYLSKYFFAGHACLLAGGYDIPDTAPDIPAEGVADWLLDNSVAVDTANIRALVSVDDNSYDAFVRAYGVLGMVQDVHYREISGAPYSEVGGTAISGHGAVLNDPRYTAQRLEACFRPPLE